MIVAQLLMINCCNSMPSESLACHGNGASFDVIQDIQSMRCQHEQNIPITLFVGRSFDGAGQGPLNIGSSQYHFIYLIFK